MRARLFQRGERHVERFHRGLDQLRRLRGAPLQPAHRGRECGYRGISAAQHFEGLAQILGHLLRLHHHGAAVGQRGLFTWLRRQLVELVDRMPQPFALAFGALDLGAVRVGGLLRGAARFP